MLVGLTGCACFAFFKHRWLRIRAQIATDWLRHYSVAIRTAPMGAASRVAP